MSIRTLEELKANIDTLKIDEWIKHDIYRTLSYWKHTFNNPVITHIEDLIKISWDILINGDDDSDFVNIEYCYKHHGEFSEPDEYFIINNWRYFLSFFEGNNSAENQKLSDIFLDGLQLPFWKIAPVYEFIHYYTGDLNTLIVKHLNFPLENSNNIICKFDLINEVRCMLNWNINTQEFEVKITDYYYNSIKIFLTHLSKLHDAIL